ncbi:sodium:proton antiporter [Botrimarina sp.]|uniref:sodium:proton antiporter n=1 Tax=Botrimarina sp. TaxID=2795802 RepID=UPI0032EF019C
MSDSSHGAPSAGPVVGAILAVVLVYAGSLALGLPQRGTEIIAAASAAHGDEHAEPGAEAVDLSEEEVEVLHEETEDGHDHEHADPDASHGDAAHGPAGEPELWTVAPFILLLLAIAVLPLIPATEHWWESNRNRFLVAAGLGVLTLLYYGLMYGQPIESHWPAHSVVTGADSAFNWPVVRTVLENAILGEFIPFIVLLFSLYTISGGIRITGDLQANPATNMFFMAVGGILASFIGTTGAAMLLIRPLLETNQERRHVVHTVVFFIFIVCNCGGCLLPIGDPPLFLGYLRGVDFFWTLNLWKSWAACNGLLLLLYLLLDEIVYYRRETEADITRDIRNIRFLKFQGLAVNGPLLLGVVLAVALLDPSKPIPGTDWHPWMYLREVAQLGLVALSLWLGSQRVRDENRFNYHAILEVAALFSGIFICMQPALQILNAQGAQLGISSPMAFFWITGGLSSVLDNAPTYVVFFETARTLPPMDGHGVVAGVAEPRLVAISLGAVFLGAMTYIGNGPNFMVRAIAESSGVRMPSFFGYMLYSVVLLLPILALVAWLRLG